MGRISVDRREEEKKRAEAAYQARVAMLKEAGSDDKAVGRDAKIRQLKAAISKARRQIRAIAVMSEHVAKAKADKAAAAAAPKQEKKAAPKPKKDAKDKDAKPKAPKKGA